MRFEDLLLGEDGALPAIPENHPAFPNFAGRDRLALDCPHSHTKYLL